MGYLKISNLYKLTDILLFKEVYCCEKIDGCLHGETLIAMSDGSKKRIKNIEPGDCVISYNEDLQIFEEDIVQANPFSLADTTIWHKLEFSDGKMLICTEDHLILTTDGYKEAKKLQKNDEIISIL
jgi:intein/homing endonuclease